MIQRIVAFTIIGLLVAAGVQQANAQTVPIKINGGGTAPFGASVFGFDSPHNATGNGNHLGKYTGHEGVFQSTDFSLATLSGTFQGRFVFVAANGDRLVCTYGDMTNGAEANGDYMAVPSTADPGKFEIMFCAEFNPLVEECTGRFAKLTGGSFTLLATTEPIELALDGFGFTPPFAYTWEGEGTLTFARGKSRLNSSR